MCRCQLARGVVRRVLVPLCLHHMPVAVRRRPLEDRTRPHLDQVLCRASDMRLDALRQTVEHHHTPKAAHLETNSVDRHGFKHGEQLALNVQCRKTLIGQRLKPALHTLEQIVVENSLLEMGSGKHGTHFCNVLTTVGNRRNLEAAGCLRRFASSSSSAATIISERSVDTSSSAINSRSWSALTHVFTGSTASPSAAARRTQCSFNLCVDLRADH